MLVSFAVENWACFRDLQEFSMETAGRVSDRFAFNTSSAGYPRLNRAAAIYGPNGSGKSRFVAALSFMQDFVLDSAKGGQSGDRIDAVPFRFDVEKNDSPSRFEIAFIQDDTVYEYGFSVDSRRVWGEWLYVRPPGRRIQRWLTRSFDPLTEEYDWSLGPSLRGSRQTWRRATRSEALFVSTAVQLNSEPLRPIVEWFRSLVVFGPGGLPHIFTSESLGSEPEFRPRLIDFLKQADISVTDIRVLEEELDLDKMARHIPEVVMEMMRKSEQKKVLKPQFGFPVKGSSDLAYLDLTDQSDGTQRIFSFADPWLNVIDNERVIVVDELDHSLHPHLVRFLVGRINVAMKTKAQLIVTVHDATLLHDALDRNQVWFTEKDVDQSSRLTALSDFHPRKSESLVRGYLGGRYGGIPNIPEADFVD